MISLLIVAHFCDESASMGEPGGVQKYLYWANRRILQWLDDSGVKVPEPHQSKLETPSGRGFLPTFARTYSEGRKTKPELASIFQRSFGRLIVSDLSSPPPIAFASGTGPVAFGEFVSPDGTPQRALIYASVPVEHGDPVVVCLFGSLENYADFVVEADARRSGGWTSSAGDIERFLLTCQSENGDLCHPDEGISREAVLVCCRQGEKGSNANSRKGYNRDFTYGETRGVSERCAEIYRDIDLSTSKLGPAFGHSRVLVGAPLWVRTPTLRSILLYSDYSKDELEEMDEESRVSSIPPCDGKLERAVRWPGLSCMDRLLGRGRALTPFDDQSGYNHEKDAPGEP